MRYSMTNPYMPYLIDELKTGNYGEDDCGVFPHCCDCGETIERGKYYDVDGRVFCMKCEDAAAAYIFDNVKDEYIYEC